MYILGIETSCDETSVALMKDNKIIKCWTWTQIKYFQKYGGVVPNIASELHSQNLPILLNEIIDEYPDIMKKIKYIAYTSKPGLIGCLHVGRGFAETLALFFQAKLIPINHLHAHLYIAQYDEKIEWPAIGLVVSGGHTQLYYMKKNLSFEVLGETMDDAAGEVLDKIGRKMGLGYPCGAKIEKLAQKGKSKYKLNVYKNKKNLDFSFSGLKTHALQTWNKIEKNEQNIHDFAYSLQKTIVDLLVSKIELACAKYSAKTVIVGGGVAANQILRKQLKQNLKIKLLVPTKEYCTDNAAMIGFLGYFQIQNSSNK